MTGHQKSERQVVITGLGVVSPIGLSLEEFTKNLREGTSGIRPVTTLAFTPAPHHVAGEIRDFNPSSFAKSREQKKAIRVMCREIQLGYAAAILSMDHGGIKEGTIAPERLGVEFGANLMFSVPEDLAEGCFAATDEGEGKFRHELWAEKGMPKLFPLWLLKYLPNMPACHIGITADARGPNNSITLDEASANLVIGEALRVIARGHADVMITGSTGTRLHALKTIHACMWDQLASDFEKPEQASRPFDARRSGQVVGEAAASLLLEDVDSAKRRGATVYGTVLGAGSACANAGDTPNLRLAMSLAMKAALRDAGLTPDQIGHINAHGLSDPKTDVAEAGAIHDVFGSLGDKVPVTALKSFWGNAAAGTGMIEILGSLTGLREGFIPPTLTYSNPEPACRLNVVREPVAPRNPVFLKLSVTRLGQASATVLQGVV
ncbi:MAG: beta-ketoacyl-[acyl-carrier-protein] synthase family protein [Planctomycetaceae bacterium]